MHAEPVEAVADQILPMIAEAARGCEWSPRRNSRHPLVRRQSDFSSSGETAENEGDLPSSSFLKRLSTFSS
jgi:hypothetical protein